VAVRRSRRRYGDRDTEPTHSETPATTNPRLQRSTPDQPGHEHSTWIAEGRRYGSADRPTTDARQLREGTRVGSLAGGALRASGLSVGMSPPGPRCGVARRRLKRTTARLGRSAPVAIRTTAPASRRGDKLKLHGHVLAPSRGANAAPAHHRYARGRRAAVVAQSLAATRSDAAGAYVRAGQVLVTQGRSAQRASVGARASRPAPAAAR
jgi:hypothetical protein